MVGTLEFDVEPTDVVVAAWEGAGVAPVFWLLGLLEVGLVVPVMLVVVVLVVLLQWVYMLLFVAASSLEPVFIV